LWSEKSGKIDVEVEEVKGRVGEKEKVLFKIKPEAFLKRVSGILGKKVREVVGSGKDRDRVRAREHLSYLSRRCTELEVKSSAEVLKTDPTCVSRSVARVDARIEDDKKLKKSLDEMAKDLENITYQARFRLNLAMSLPCQMSFQDLAPGSENPHPFPGRWRNPPRQLKAPPLKAKPASS